MKKQTAASSFRAFTLIELLVVIAIILILAAILFPVFAQARENARRASCISNVRQMGLGVMMYTQDYDEFYPPCNSTINQTPPDGENWGGGWWYWQQQIYPYTKSDQIYVCPSSTSSAPLTDNYGANYLIMRDGRSFLSLSVAAVNFPTDTYLLMDFGIWRIDPQFIQNTMSGWGWLPGSGLQGATGFYQTNQPADWDGRHFDGVTVAFADGHAKWLKSAAVYQQALDCTGCEYNYVVPNPASSAWNPYSPKTSD